MNSSLLRISLALFLCCCLGNYVFGASIESAKATSSGINYLVKFGYLQRKDPKTGQIMSQSDLIQSIRSLQRFAGLNQTGVMDAATIALMGKSRCGVADASPADQVKRKRRYTLHGTYWTKKDLTYRIKGYTRDVSRKEQERIYKWAFKLWSEASKIRVTEAPQQMSDDKVDILIDWKRFDHGDGYPFDGPGGTLAHAFYPHNNKGISGDAHFDDDERYTTGDKDTSGVDLAWVALHEFGHSLGLDHSTVHGSIMFPWYGGYKKDIKLTEDDIMGIQGIYGKPVRPVPTDGPTSGSKNTAPPSKVPHFIDECRLAKYDAWLQYQGKTYAFVGDYYFIVNPHTVGVIDGPLKIRDKWPAVRTPINTVYKRLDQRVIFFKEGTYWQYFDDYLERGPKPISHYGLPKELKSMDGAFVWGRNHRTYFFKDNHYWRFNDQNKIDNGYPRKISVWKGIPSNVDSVLKWKNGKTYFFKGKEYYKFDDYAVHAEIDYPKSIAIKWMRCDSSRLVAPTTTNPTTSRNVSMVANNHSPASIVVPSLVILVSSLWLAARGI